jgi:hypothetical protein
MSSTRGSKTTSFGLKFSNQVECPQDLRSNIFGRQLGPVTEGEISDQVPARAARRTMSRAPGQLNRSPTIKNTARTSSWATISRIRGVRSGSGPSSNVRTILCIFFVFRNHDTKTAGSTLLRCRSRLRHGSGQTRREARQEPDSTGPCECVGRTWARICHIAEEIRDCPGHKSAQPSHLTTLRCSL